MLVLSTEMELFCSPSHKRVLFEALVETICIITDFTRKGQHIFITGLRKLNCILGANPLYYSYGIADYFFEAFMANTLNLPVGM